MLSFLAQVLQSHNSVTTLCCDKRLAQSAKRIFVFLSSSCTPFPHRTRFLSPECTLIFKHVAPAGWSLGRTPARPPLTLSEDTLAPGSEKGISNFQLSPAGEWLWILLISIYTSPLATAKKKREEGSWPSAHGIGHSLSKYRAGMSGGGTGYKSRSGSPLALLWVEESERPAQLSSVCGSEDHTWLW